MNLSDALAAARAGLTAPLAGYLAHPPAAEYRDAWVTDVLAALDDGAFSDDAAPMAVDAVLACGYPWALQLTPEHLDRLRNAHVKPPEGFWAAALVASGWALFILLFRSFS